jgi:hypothetical protein
MTFAKPLDPSAQLDDTRLRGMVRDALVDLERCADPVEAALAQSPSGADRDGAPRGDVRAGLQ